SYMVDQITFQTISIVIAAATVVIGVVNSIISGRREEKQRQDQVILQRFQGYGLDYTRSWVEVIDTYDWKDFEEFNQKYGRKVNPEFRSKWLFIMATYNLAGISLKRGVDPDLIFQLYNPNAVNQLWELYEPVVKGIREANNFPLFLEPLEYLYNEAKKRQPEIRHNRT
ncbi:DUF4760 domain-containing protein, partial [[Eubacterium] cellulosolvens]